MDEIVKADPDWRAAMARRGLTTTSARSGPARSPRACSGRPTTTGAGWCECSRSSRPASTTWPGRIPVDGIAAYVDLVEKKVFKVIDEFELPGPGRVRRLRRRGGARPAPHHAAPIEITQPEGPSFTLDGHALRWQDWSMRIGFDAREGLTLHQISLHDDGGGR